MLLWQRRLKCEFSTFHARGNKGGGILMTCAEMKRYHCFESNHLRKGGPVRFSGLKYRILESERIVSAFSCVFILFPFRWSGTGQYFKAPFYHGILIVCVPFRFSLTKHDQLVGGRFSSSIYVPRFSQLDMIFHFFSSGHLLGIKSRLKEPRSFMADTALYSEECTCQTVQPILSIGYRW